MLQDECSNSDVPTELCHQRDANEVRRLWPIHDQFGWQLVGEAHNLLGGLAELERSRSQRDS